jgi:hypothetical protein
VKKVLDTNYGSRHTLPSHRSQRSALAPPPPSPGGATTSTASRVLASARCSAPALSPPTEGPHHRSIHGAPRARAATSSAWAAAAWRSEQTSDGQPCGASHRRATEREASVVLYDANGVPAVAG